jgi:S-adenosylmethionine:tRNA ribosyltransferase-isomerase
LADATTLDRFDYRLPLERIAQEPAEPRDAARLLILDRATGDRQDATVRDLPRFLRSGDCLVVNDTRVVPARLLGEIVGTGRPVEVLLVRELAGGEREALVRPGRHCRPGTVLLLADGRARAVVTGLAEAGRRRLRLEWPGTVADLLAGHGLPPLPPYIRHYRKPEGEDWRRYQTVYAARDGAVAAPTAGLHFTPELLDTLEAQGVERHAITLHVGPGTFRPVRVARVSEHHMEAEQYQVSEGAGQALSAARRDGRRVMAVGTTTARVLESVATAAGGVRAGEGWTDLTITPGHRFRVVDALLTNFHLPRSSLLLLVAAFAGRERVLDAYHHAIAAGYRFYSYGDAMLIL